MAPPPHSLAPPRSPAPRSPLLANPKLYRDAARRELARRSLAEFLKQAWPILEPATPLIWGWHIDALCEVLEAVTRKELRRLVIAVPPGHMKSTITSVVWPAWCWVQRPEWRSLFASHALNLSVRDSVKTRLIVESEWYRENFSTPAGWALADDQNAKVKFLNTRQGSRELVAMGGGTGARGDSVLVDDPLSVKQGMSEDRRREVIEWWDTTMSTRLNDMETGAHVIIGQRLHRSDLSGHVLAQGGYEHLCLPAEYDSRRRAVVHVQMGPRAGDVVVEDRRTVDGELLFPEKFPASVIADLKTKLGSAQAAGQLAQDPVAEGGSIFKREWWRFWRASQLGPVVTRPKGCSPAPAVMLPARFDSQVITVDAAFKDKSSSDYVVMQVWGVVGANRFLLDQVRGRMSFTDTVTALRALCAKWPKAGRKLVEDKANGSAIINALQHEIPGLIAVNPEGGKEVRAHACSPVVEAGQVFLPEEAVWIGEYVDELADFPFAPHDDQVDATTQLLNALLEPDAVTRLRMLVTR